MKKKIGGGFGTMKKGYDKAKRNKWVKANA